MASSINTNGLNVNYPVPGVNNNSQGFRNNFQNIKTNLELASAEITDLQDSVVVKNPIGTAAINNDMGNVLISNCATLGFRSTMYNLGSAITGTIVVDLALADVHYGILAGNILLNFGNWAPTGTLSKVTLQLQTSNVAADYSISFPGEVVISNENSGGALLNNFANVGGVPTITFPHNCTQLNIDCYSMDCGNTVFLTPVNRPFQSTQIIKRTPPSTGEYGDMAGAVCVSEVPAQLAVTSSTSSDFFVTSNTATLYTGMPVSFTGTSFESNITAGGTYYVGNIANSTHFTVSANANASGNVNLTGSSGNMYLNPISYLYIATDDFNATITNKSITETTSPNTIVVTGSMATVNINAPIIFTGDDPSSTGVEVGEVYYIKSVSGQNITVSKTRYNGVAGATYEGINTVASANVDVDFNVFNGSDIFSRIPLQPF